MAICDCYSWCCWSGHSFIYIFFPSCFALYVRTAVRSSSRKMIIEWMFSLINIKERERIFFTVPNWCLLHISRVLMVQMGLFFQMRAIEVITGIVRCQNKLKWCAMLRIQTLYFHDSTREKKTKWSWRRSSARMTFYHIPSM